MAECLYSYGDGDVFIPMLADTVTVNNVTYVKGMGINVRVWPIASADVETFQHSFREIGCCECTPPALWLFTGIDPETGATVSVQTVNPHDALTLLLAPDVLFEASSPEPTSVDIDGRQAHMQWLDTQPMHMVSPGEPFAMVVAETIEWLGNYFNMTNGDEHDSLPYSDVADVNIDEMIAGLLDKEGE